MFIQVSNLGTTSYVDNQKDLLKAMGVEQPYQQKIILTDEQGELVGIGHGVEAMMKSMPIIAAIKEMPLHKPKTKNQNSDESRKTIA